MLGGAHHLPALSRPPSRHVTLPAFALPLPHASPAADAEEGGETAFPAGKWLNKELQAAGKPFSDCAKSGVAALPR